MEKPRKDIFIALCFFALIEIATASFGFGSGNLIFSAVVCAFYFIPFALLLFPWLWFCVEADENNITVKPRFKKGYSFGVSDIQKISYTFFYRKYYIKTDVIEITAANKKIEIDETMTGFADMAWYLLEHHKSKAISDAAISKHCQTELKRIKNKEATMC